MLLAAPAAAQEEDPRAVAERVHREGGYASDVTPFVPDPGGEVGSAGDTEGAGRGARGSTITGDRDAGDRGTGEEGILARVLRQILQWLDGMLGALGGPLAWLLLALGLAVLALFVGYLVARVRWGEGAARVEARSTGGAAGDVDPMLIAPSMSADELAAQGRYGEAIHALFVDALGRIGGREGRLRGRTARELVGAVDRARAGRPELGDLLDLTELVWFGGRDASADQYAHARALAAQVPTVDRSAERDALDRAAPDRGGPDRGGPDRGGPDRGGEEAA